MLKLTVIIASTRPGRAGLPIANWFVTLAKNGPFEVQVADLAELNLPLLDEPAHPRLKQYQREHTKRWSAIVDGSDAFVTVTPEYNFSSPPAFINALDYLYSEWQYKPMAFVSYGGISGGLRSTQMSKLTVSALGMMPLPGGVTLPFFSKHLADGVFKPEEVADKSAMDMLTELHRWAVALKTMRTP